ncbi:Xanthine and CO dehydrogenase maturation factor, XdhC/CoxF family [Flavobacteriaceae bacterium MAR_2010_188]|nr:Xanthine and CO dehydrogenase maturation factor, XdhC/CoxF family [Flavobacteriaceae bacterium MAR_2010_188]
MKELQSILLQGHTYFLQNKKCVLATIVKIKGSGYRRKGTRMLISEEGEFTGAISGGCVEKEVWMQSKSVFETGNSKLITYDGRYRLGCEGTLFILIELIEIDNTILENFNTYYIERQPLTLQSYFRSADASDGLGGTYFKTEINLIPLNSSKKTNNKDLAKLECFSQILKPVRSLLIFGSEHDSVALCKMASLTSWDVTIVAHPLNEKEISFFPGAKDLVHLLPEELDSLQIDSQTACILMSHSFSRDLAYLLELSNFKIPYIGLLGPHKRKNQLLDQLIERKPEISDQILDTFFGPVGLDIGAETPQEIAIAVLGELQSVFTKTHVDHLRNKSGSIHARR